MLSQEVEILNDLGMHARASAKLTQLAGQFKSDIWLSRKGKKVNAKSIMGIMMLAATQHTLIEIIIEGIDEIGALFEIETLINNRFGEEN